MLCLIGQKVVPLKHLTGKAALPLHPTERTKIRKSITTPNTVAVSERYAQPIITNTKFGLKKKTGVDLPGEAGTIMHKMENMGNVELATVAFGQSFQITPIQMATTVSSLVNGGKRVTPHFGISIEDGEGTVLEQFQYEEKKGIVSEKTSETMRMLLKSVVEEGSGRNGAVEGYSVGGKTATSQTLPRSANKYISSFIGFAPAENPQVLGIVVIRNPQGVYYGGTIAAPVLRSIYDNVLPYLGIEKS